MLVVDRIRKNEYRNAALMAKTMFDIMLDDAELKGLTDKMEILKDCSMICYFLNAVICLYGNRYEEAVGYAEMVLNRKQCLEAMFIKGRALYELGKYDEAYDVVCQIVTISKEGEEKKAIDKKLLLFEARVYEKLGNPNLAICQRLLKLCPEYMEGYIMLRKEARRLGLHLEFEETDENMTLAIAFENEALSDNDFRKMLTENKDKKDIRKLGMLVKKLKNEL
jgi:tetratricopeptide (TPR) repeat protein